MPDIAFVECDVDMFKNLQTYYARYHPEADSASVVFELRFPTNFPNEPPFCIPRLIRPRMQFRTGHITIGGSVCAQELTSGNWDPSMTISHVLQLIFGQLVEGNAVVDLNQGHDYTEREAREAHERVARAHGWTR